MFRRCCLPLIEFLVIFPGISRKISPPTSSFWAAPCPDRPWDSVVLSGTWRSFPPFSLGEFWWNVLEDSSDSWLFGCFRKGVAKNILLCSADLKPMDLGYLGSWTYAVPISTTSLCIREASKRSWSSVAIGDFFSAIEVRPWSYLKWS